MAEDQSKEVDLTEELEREYNEFLAKYEKNLCALNEQIGRVKGLWPQGQKRTSDEVLNGVYRYTQGAYEWLGFFLEEIKRIRTRTFRREIELADAIQKTTKALRKIQSWMDKYDPTLRRFEEDYQAALGRASNQQPQGQQGGG